MPHDENLCEANVLLWEKYTKAMQNKISSRTYFSAEISNNPIELPKSIKKHSSNFKEICYEMSIVTDALQRFMNTHKRSTKVSKITPEDSRQVRIT